MTKATRKKKRPTKTEFEKRLKGVSKEEVIAAVARHFCAGLGASEVLSAVNKELKTELRREDPLRFLRQAGLDNRLRYVAPREAEWAQAIQEKHGLKAVRVVRSTQIDDMASYGSQMLLDLIKQRAISKAAAKTKQQGPSLDVGEPSLDLDEPSLDLDEQALDLDEPSLDLDEQPKKLDESAIVRIGFGGGATLHSLASHLSLALTGTSSTQLPTQLWMHAMVGSSAHTSVMTPSYFFGKFIDAPSPVHDIHFLNLPAPPIVSLPTYQALLKEPVIMEAIDYKKKLDIICSSAGNWFDGHSYVCQQLARWSRGTLVRFQKAGCIGDLLWLPLDRKGNCLSKPGDRKSDSRPMTLLSELAELAELIENGLDCLVVLGPCRKCTKTKSDVLAAILRAGLVTHLVVDSRTAGPVVPELD